MDEEEEHGVRRMFCRRRISGIVRQENRFCYYECDVFCLRCILHELHCI